MSITIRFVTPADLSAVAQVESACFPSAEAATVDAFATRIRTFPESFLVACQDDKILGILNGCCTDGPELADALYEPHCPHDPSAPWQTVFGLAVLPEAQHQGIAGALMRHMISLCRQRGKQGIILTCKEEKISFYQGFGFQCRGKSDSCHGGVIWYDMILPLTDLSV